MRNPLARATTGTTLKLHAGLAAVAYIPLLLTRPGWVSADTKTYLYLDPAKLMSRAWSMWDPSIGMGTVTHQNIGYLWPMGPFYWITEVLGLPDWASQRLWWGTIIFAAGAGVAYLLRVLGWRGPGVTAAVFVYALTPYLLTLVSRLSAILLPFSALPWLVAFTIQAVRHRGWRYPALFALTVATCGSVNATALLLVGVAPALWLVHAVWGSREVSVRTAVRAGLKIGALTVPTSLWWIAGLSVQSTNGIEILRYTETAKVVSASSVSHEVLRGLGYWFFYGTDRLGPWIQPSVDYTQWLPLLLATYVLPLAGIWGAVVARWRHRAYFVGLVLVGTALAVGAYPWDKGPPFSRLVQVFQGSDAGLAMRSLPRAVPLVVLGMAVLLGSGVASVSRRWPRQARWSGFGVAVLATLCLPALWLGQFVPDNLRRPSEIPEYWKDAADYVDSRGSDTRVLVLPGSDFASYRWGNTVDPILPGLIDRPSVQHELIPYGSPASANLLNALDLKLQERTADPDSIAAIARLMRAGDILVQSDLQYERYNTPRPRNFWDFMQRAKGLGKAVAFGRHAANTTIGKVQLDDEVLFATDPKLQNPPQLAVMSVDDAIELVNAQSAQHPLIVAGDGAGLVEAAGAGLIDGSELIRYSASLDDADITAAMENDAALLLTDSNRKRGERWTTVRHTRGYTETENGGALDDDLGDNRLPVFPDEDTDNQTIVDRGGDISAEATSYGNPITFTPEERPILAVDGDPQTSWRAAAFSPSPGERIELTLRRPATTNKVRLLQPVKGPATRFITKVRLRFDDKTSYDVDLTEQSRARPGQTITLPSRLTFKKMSVEILEDSKGELPRYVGQSSVGFAEIEVLADENAPDNSRLDETVRLPTDLLDAAGAASKQHPLAILLTRVREDPLDPTRADEESELRRSFHLPTSRDFSLTGEARLSGRADPEVIDELLGRPHNVGTNTWVRAVADLTGTVQTASAVFDGDPTTSWQTVRSRPLNQWVEVVLQNPVTIDHLPLSVVTDQLHSIPKEVELWVDGKPAATLKLPKLDRKDPQNATTDVDLKLPKAFTGTQFRVKLTDVDTKLTNDWVSDKPIAQPAALAEIGLPGPKVPALPATFDSGCRGDLLAVDGTSDPSGRVPIRVTGPMADALAGRPLQITTCDNAPVRIEGGDVELVGDDGFDTGIDLDQLALRSAIGGDASTDASTLVGEAAAADAAGGRSSGTAAAQPTVKVLEDDNDHVKVQVTGATAEEPFWLVLGQSFNEGWSASADGKTLAPPELVDGFANGWYVVPDKGSFTVDLTFSPQRRVNLALWLSVLTGLLCIALILKRPRLAVVAPSAMPEPYSPVLAFRYHGALPSRRTAWLAGLAVGILSWALAGAAVGLFVGVVAGIGARHEKFRRWLLLGSPAALAIAVLYVLYIQARWDPLPSFDWPYEMRKVHPLGWLAVLLLVADVIIGRIWQSRSTEIQD